MSSNKNEKSIKNLIRLMKKELKDLRIHDLLDDPKLKEAFRRAKPKHWSELTEDEREAQAKEQAEAEQEFVREQRFLRVKRVLQSIIEAKCNEPNSRLFTTAEELLEFVVKYESSPSSVSNYEWNKFETILLTRLESLLQVDGKEEEPTETEQGNKRTKREREVFLEPKPPETLAKILWIWKHGRQHWKLVCVGILVLLISGVFALPKFNLFGNKYQGTHSETENTLHKPIVVASATVEVKITSDLDFNGRVANTKAYLAFVKGNKPLLITSSIGYTASQTGNNEVVYKAKLDMDAKDSAVGNPTSFLKDAEYIQIEFGRMPSDSCVLEGDAICIINNSVRLEFSIPPQKLVNNRIFIRNLILQRDFSSRNQHSDTDNFL